MISLLKNIPPVRLLTEQLPALASAWVIAELFYKFHSFSLECAAFLLTWAGFDFVMHSIRRAFRERHALIGSDS